MSVSIAVIGECMLELTHSNTIADASAKPLNLRYGGDTLNTAVYLSRHGVDVSYFTALGDDELSDWMIKEWRAEGVDCANVIQQPGRVPGMYMVNVAANGERSFLYWRKDSPASQMFRSDSAIEHIANSLNAFEYVYLSGISLAILDETSLQKLLNVLNSYRSSGGKIVFDGNYRPHLWGTPERAKKAYQAIYRLTDIALPTLEDEAELFGFESAEEVINATLDYGVREVVVKQGAKGCLAHYDGNSVLVEAEKVKPIDTTAAGDSFNAAYLAVRFDGQDVSSACRSGHRLAGKVVEHSGAIIPLSAQ